MGAELERQADELETPRISTIEALALARILLLKVVEGLREYAERLPETIEQEAVEVDEELR